MKQRFRQIFYLILFWIFGPLATLVLMLGICARHSSLTARNYESILLHKMGIAVTIGRVEYLRPGLIKFRRVVWNNSGVQAAIPDLTLEEVRPKESSSIFYRLHAPKMAWHLPRSESRNAPSVETLITFLRHALSGDDFRETSETPEKNSPILLCVDQLTITREASPLAIKLFSLQSRAHFATSAFELEGSFVMSEGTTSESVTWSILQNDAPNNLSSNVPSNFSSNLQSASPKEFANVTDEFIRTRIQFATSQAMPIPLPLLAIFMPSLEIAGLQSRFVGSIRAEETWETNLAASVWSIYLKDVTLRNMDLASFASHFTTYHASGTIEGICIEEAHWRDGIISASGWFHLMRGALEVALLERIVKEFDVQTYPADLVTRPILEPKIPFEQFGIRYQLSRRGAIFSPPSDNGIIMQDAAKTISLLIPRPTQPTPYAKILTALIPQTAPQVPWTPQTKQALQILPTEPQTFPR